MTDKHAHIVNKHVNDILGCIGDPITAGEFAVLLANDQSGSCQKQEDDAFVRLYRGYDEQDIKSWVCLVYFPQSH